MTEPTPTLRRTDVSHHLGLRRFGPLLWALILAACAPVNHPQVVGALPPPQQESRAPSTMSTSTTASATTLPPTTVATIAPSSQTGAPTTPAPPVVCPSGSVQAVVQRVTNDAYTIANGTVQHWSVTAWMLMNNTLGRSMAVAFTVTFTGHNSTNQPIATTQQYGYTVVPAQGNNAPFPISSDLLSAPEPTVTATITWTSGPATPGCPPPAHN